MARPAKTKKGVKRATKKAVKRAKKKAVPKPAAAPDRSAAAPSTGDIDLRALGQALARKKRWIIIPTLLAAALSIISVNLVTPRYKSEARILVDGRENIFLRPNGERNEERTSVDAEAVTSQVQLLLSRGFVPVIMHFLRNKVGPDVVSKLERTLRA